MSFVALRTLSRGGLTGSLAAGVLLTSAGASGAVLLEAGGWRAEVDDALLSSVDLFVDFESFENDILVLEKFAQFRNVSDLTGQPDSINITFTQIAPDDETITRIAITDEAVTNLTGLTWSGFEMALLDSGDAVFNQSLSGDFSVAPFDTTAFSGDSTTVRYSMADESGAIPDNTTWFPGAAAGELVVDLTLDRQEPLVFTLKELPLPVPAPGVSALLIAGAGLGATRRRRA